MITGQRIRNIGKSVACKLGLLNDAMELPYLDD